ncbi:hypothetical protein GGR52DRAFT_471323 [Hypoxylon sp. FL1284]|nr:hypothetical protein GGR52DRAFT_471323 [Hypoxylon sp. FL1284]
MFFAERQSGLSTGDIFQYYSYRSVPYVEKFCQHADSFADSRTIARFFKFVFLQLPITDIIPCWIHGNSLWYYSGDGSIKQNKLQDEERFRMAFHKGQEKAGIPEWARISPNVGGVYTPSHPGENAGDNRSRIGTLSPNSQAQAARHENAPRLAQMSIGSILVDDALPGFQQLLAEIT